MLGTAQFGMDYGIVNVSGKPTKNVIFGILDLAWEKGIRRFDTAPGYGSEALLGEFIMANGLQDEAIILIKTPSLENSNDYKQFIRISLESSLENLGCPVDILFFHNPVDSKLLLEYPDFFGKLLHKYPVSTLGVSVYEPQEVEQLFGCHFELAFQFPFNVLDRRFEHVNVPKGKRYARSVFLQGVLASPNGLRLDAPLELFNLQKKYHDKLADNHLDPVSFAISFALRSDAVDYLLIGVDSAKQLQDILELNSYNQEDLAILDAQLINIDERWFDPRNWS